MQRNYQPAYSNVQNNQELIKQTAFHEAGHASSIYLGNKQKKLPPVFFQIQIRNTDCQLSAKVIDGRLIQNLPIAGLEGIKIQSYQERIKYQCAYEADVVHLLVGPLAEAKYVSQRDGEEFNFNLLNTNALKFYGGSSDVEKANAYLKYFMSTEAIREEKMLELFLQAFQFIENNSNWGSICNLANTILHSEKESLSCEEAIEVINQCEKKLNTHVI